MWDTLLGHSCKPLLYNSLVGQSCDANDIHNLLPAGWRAYRLITSRGKSEWSHRYRYIRLTKAHAPIRKLRYAPLSFVQRSRMMQSAGIWYFVAVLGTNMLSLTSQQAEAHCCCFVFIEFQSLRFRACRAQCLSRFTGP